VDDKAKGCLSPDDDGRLLGATRGSAGCDRCGDRRATQSLVGPRALDLLGRLDKALLHRMDQIIGS
jgi:hypothetical protein